jgi:hypothetical protein
VAGRRHNGRPVTARALVKLAVSPLLPRAAVPIVCASIGRVGSTLVYRTLAGDRAAALFGARSLAGPLLIRGVIGELKDARFRRGGVYKTHDFPHHLVAATPLRVVFLYGRPSDSVLSLIRCRDTKGAAWMRRHFAHMHADGSYGELLQRDVLRIGEQITTWRAARNADILGLRYETLWKNVGILSDFVGFRVNLPSRVERLFADLPPEIVGRARATYESLDSAVSALPDYFHSSPHEQA